MTVPVRAATKGDVIESVIAKGDLARLSPEERTQYYVQLCQSMGLNPHTQPFAFLTLNGKLTLYAKRDAADQLRKINGISIEVISRSIEDGMLTVHVRATDRNNRTDEDFGVVALPDTVKGEARANTILKGITKAKRRVTLSISGLGFLDETEVEDIPRQTARARIAAIAELPDVEQRYAEAEKMHDEWSDRAAESMHKAMTSNKPEHDADGVVWEEDGERPASPEDFESPPTSRPANAAPPVNPSAGGAAVLTESETIARFDKDLADAAEAGTAALAAEWKQVPVRYRPALMAAKDRRHKPRAAEVDKEAKG